MLNDLFNVLFVPTQIDVSSEVQIVVAAVGALWILGMLLRPIGVLIWNAITHKQEEL